MRLNISETVNYNEIENLYHQIYINKNVDEIDLVVPTKLVSKQMGVYSELIQLIITWSRLSNGKLFIDLNSDTSNFDDDLDTYFRRFWNFCAGAMSFKKGIFTSDNIEITDKVKKTINERNEFILQNERWKKGDSSFIFAIQHSLNSYPKGFYLGDGTLKKKKEFIEISKNVLSEIIKSFRISSSVDLIKDNEKLIGEIIFELIENTHFWSQDDFKGVGFDTGIRGLLTSVHRGKNETLIKNCKDDVHLLKYINEITSKNVDCDILEISVFDSGSGLASKYLEKNILDFENYQQIYDTILECLKKGNTSDNYSLYERGFGLFNIMKLLNSTGYLKIRTNGLKLFRNFIDEPFSSEHPSNKDYILNDWHKKQGVKKLKYISEGTLISIFLPLNVSK